MKIVYFIDHLRPDGTQRVLQQLVGGLGERDHTQAVVCLNDSWDERIVRRLQASRAEVRVVGKAAMASGYGIAATWHWLRHSECDVAVTLLFFSDVFGRAIARAAQVPRIVSSIRARNTNYAGWQRALVRWTVPWADTVVLNSVATCDFAIGEEGVLRERIVVIPNGVCADDYLNPVSRATFRAELGLPLEQTLIGSVGRLTHQKGFDLLLQALAQLSRQDIDLVLIGVGEDEAKLRAQTVALGLERRIHFVGYRHDVPRLLGAFDVYVHPARFEGMPNALLEAMAAGCPIVASAVDGNRELIEDGVHGWLVQPEDVDSLAGALIDALCDPATAQRRGAAARQRAIKQFSVDTMVDMWETVLKGQVPVPGQEQ
jgi:glycosyltransferase involved in cell wall biosynthesis